MKCPKSYRGRLLTHNTVEESWVDCLKTNCEWWSETSQQCRICIISGELYSLVEVMEEIRDQIGRLILQGQGNQNV